MRYSGHEESDTRGDGAGEGDAAGGAVDVAAEEVVDGDVPFAGELNKTRVG